MLLNTVSAGGNKQHSSSRDTAKLDRETEELHRMLNLNNYYTPLGHRHNTFLVYHQSLIDLTADEQTKCLKECP